MVEHGTSCLESLRGAVLGLVARTPIFVTVVPACVLLCFAIVLEIASVGFTTAAWLFVCSGVLFALATLVVHSCRAQVQCSPSAAAASASSKSKNSAQEVELGTISKHNERDVDETSSSEGTTTHTADGAHSQQQLYAACTQSGVGGVVGVFNSLFTYWLVLMAVVGAVFFVVAAIDAALLTGPEAPDQAFAAFVSLTLSVVCSLAIIVQFSNFKKNNARTATKGDQTSSTGQPRQFVPGLFDADVADADRCCASPCCFRFCSVLGLPLLLLLAVLILYNETVEVKQLLTLPPPGQIIYVDGFPPAHLLCENDENSKPGDPTVLFLHGFLGSALDASWIARDPAFKETGLRFCSMDRPGYGYGWPYPVAQPERHFGEVSKMTTAVLREAGITGDIVAVAHSLGGYWSMALAAHMTTTSDFNMTAVVSLDVLTPLWTHDPSDESSELVPMPEENCNVNAPLAGGVFYLTVRRILTTAIIRLLVDSGFDNYDALMRMMPRDLQATYEFQSGTRAKYFTAVTDDDARWAINCGWARLGVEAFGQLAALEVVNVPRGVNLSRHADLNHRAVLTEPAGPDLDPHSGILFDEVCWPTAQTVGLWCAYH
eukprot:INCI10445.2.p1 GENE.INCI10445.2~~INCI10445.2.p1  ORF type:complete len:602 (-),score=92.43 INCI10445.2:906-2711(-)